MKDITEEHYAKAAQNGISRKNVSSGFGMVVGKLKKPSPNLLKPTPLFGRNGKTNAKLMEFPTSCLTDD